MTAVPDHDIFQNLKKECEDLDFWNNFRDVAPVLFCFACEKDQTLGSIRDRAVTGEILRTRSMLTQMHKKVDEIDSGTTKFTPNMYHFSTCLKTLQEKVDVIKALKSPSSDPKGLKMRIAGTQKNLCIDVNKMLEAITIEHIPTEGEKEEEEKRPQKPKIDVDISEADSQYLDNKLEGVRIKEQNGLIEKHSMLKILKLVSEYTKEK